MPRSKDPNAYWNRLDEATRPRRAHDKAVERAAPSEYPLMLEPSDLETVPDLDVLVIPERAEHEYLLQRHAGEGPGITHTKGGAVEDWEYGGGVMDPIKAQLADARRAFPARRRLTAEDLP